MHRAAAQLCAGSAHPLECRSAVPQPGRLPGPAGVDARPQRLPQQGARHLGVVQRQLGQPLAAAVLQAAGREAHGRAGCERVKQPLAVARPGGGAPESKSGHRGGSCRRGLLEHGALLQSCAHLSGHESARRAALHNGVNRDRPPCPAPRGGVNDVLCGRRDSRGTRGLAAKLATAGPMGPACPCTPAYAAPPSSSAGLELVPNSAPTRICIHLPPTHPPGLPRQPSSLQCSLSALPSSMSSVKRRPRSSAVRCSRFPANAAGCLKRQPPGMYSMTRQQLRARPGQGSRVGRCRGQAGQVRKAHDCAPGWVGAGRGVGCRGGQLEAHCSAVEQLSRRHPGTAWPGLARAGEVQGPHQGGWVGGWARWLCLNCTQPAAAHLLRVISSCRSGKRPFRADAAS